MSLKAVIPVPTEIIILAEILKDGEDSVEVYLVGGALRDYLYHKYHTDQSVPFKAKDYDMATNLSEQDILRRLSSDKAKIYGITVKEKQSVDTFGVVFCSVGGKGPYEVAPFRKDVGSVDGRRPERVERGLLYDDAMRRDLTINSLYYDFNRQEIIDLTGGVEDIKNRNVRFVGDPFKRIEEDKLRILRLVRFFNRYNDGLIIERLSERTLAAIDKYKNLLSFKGMSPERIMTEFLLGLAQSRNTVTYLKSYRDLDLFDAVFGRRPVDLAVIDRLGNLKNPKVVLAMLLRIYDGDVADILNRLKYPNDISDPTQFLVDAMTFSPNDAVDILKARDKRLVKSTRRELSEEEKSQNERVQAELFQDITDMCSITDDKLRVAMMEHMVGFGATVPSGEEFMQQGFTGAEIGKQQRAYLQSAYLSSLKWYLGTRKLSLPTVE